MMACVLEVRSSKMVLTMLFSIRLIALQYLQNWFICLKSTMYVSSANDFLIANNKRGVCTMKTSGIARNNYEETEENWKEEFLDLYMSGDVEQFGQALDLKRLHIP